MTSRPLALALATAALAGVATTAAPADAGAYFAPTSIWNARIPADAPVDPSSAALVADLRGQLSRYPAWINTHEYSVPVVRVSRTVRTVPVRVGWRGGTTRTVRAPIPPGLRPAAGTDRHAVVYQPSTDRMWEFWLLERDGTRWRAGAAGYFPRASRSRGVIAAPNGATASGLALAGGLIRPAELRRGRIAHALALGIPEPRRAEMAAPATRTDGNTARTTAIPLGARLRIDPSVNLAALNLPEPTLTLARAAQEYGIVVRDTSGSVSFYAQDVRGSSPYGALFRGRSPAQVLARFPWQHLQVLRMSVRCCWRT